MSARQPGDEAARSARGVELFHRSLLGFLRDLPGSAKRFWILVLATGAAAGLGAALLVEVLDLVQRLAWPAGEDFLTRVQSAGPAERVLTPVAAGVLVTAAAALARAPLGGHGTAGVVEAIWARAGRMPLFRSLGRGLVAIVGVGLGTPLGREGALVQLGAASGSWFGERLRIPDDQKRLLVACGAASGISAAYNVPIGGALFGLEVLLGSFALELFGPIVVSCVTATLISRVLVSDHPSYLIPHYAFGSPAELLVLAAAAPLLGVASAIFVRSVEAAASVAARLPRSILRWAPPVALLAVGLAALAFPAILGNGYETVDAALLGQLPFWVLVGLPFVKLAAVALTSAAGVPGGVFTPTLFFGALTGGALGELVRHVYPAAAPVGAYALLGMGAALAGTTHAAVSATLIIFEMTGDYGLILPLMLATVVAAAVARRLEPESLYTGPLRRRNVLLPEPVRPQWLRSARVAAFVTPAAERVEPRTSFRKVIFRLLATPPGRDLYVVSPDGRYLGVIVLDRLKEHLPEERFLDAAIAVDVMDRDEPLGADVSISEAAVRLARSDLDRLPVVHPGTGELLGAISKSEVLRHGRF